MLIFKDKIKGLVDGFFAARNLPVEKIEEDLWRIEPGRELATELGCQESLLLAFSPEASEKFEGSLLVTDGSPFLGALGRIIKKNGRMAEGYPVLDGAELSTIQSGIPGGFEFVNCRPAVESTCAEYEGVLRILCKLHIESVDRREELIPVYLDLFRKKVIYPVPETLLNAEICDKPPFLGENLNEMPLNDALKLAEEHVSRIAGPVLRVMEKESEKTLKEETAKITEFFKTQEVAVKESDEKNQLRIACAGKINDLKEQRRLKVNGKIAGILKILAPVLTVKIRIEGKNSEGFLKTVYHWVLGGFEPVSCPHCGREMNRVGLCREHGACCAEEMWKCPVCGEDRCEKCEHLECSIDGKKKDPDCSFKCGFCLNSVGKDHQAVCDKCGKTGCSQCTAPCAICGKIVCPDCGSICSQCKGIFCREHLEKCGKCPAMVCSGCRLKKCEKCGVSACSQHSFVCSGCGKTLCRDCSGGVDAVTGELLCRDCIRTCPGCKKTVKKGNEDRCSKCGAETCSFCHRVCSICKKGLCRIHSSKCGICGGDLCEEHGRECPECGGTLCGSHLFACSSCGVEYCSRCGNGGLCHICSSISPVKKGRIPENVKKAKIPGLDQSNLSEIAYSEGNRLFAFSGRGMMSKHLIVVEKKTGKVLSHRQEGVFSKIMGLFSGNAKKSP